MIDYIKGAIFIAIFIVIINALGKSIHKSTKSYENFIYGYVIYTAIQSIGGVVIQFFRLPWLCYQIYMICLWITMLAIIFFKLHEERDYWNRLLKHMKQYWMIYFIALVFVVLSMININYQWNNNLIDDGYYLNKIALVPYVDNFVDLNYATGLTFTESLTRIINTFEIEAAFYSQMLGMSASIFCKIYLAYFQYVLLLFAVVWLYHILWKKETHNSLVVYPIFFILFFGIYQEILNNYNVLFLQDSWQFNTAMWYGSSVVRSIGLIVLMVPLLDTDTKYKEKGLFLLGALIMLFSKASQAFPVVVLVAVSFLFLWCYRKAKNNRWYYILILISFILLLVIPMDTSLIQREGILIELLKKNCGVILLGSFFVFLCGFFLKEPKVKQWNIWMLCIGFLMYIPKVNTLFLKTSMYDFVMGRTMTLYIFTFMMTAACYAIIFLKKVVKNDAFIKGICIISGSMLALIPLVHVQRNIGLKRSVEIVRRNKELLPSSTIKLSQTLQDISIDRHETLNVLSPAWVMMDGSPHSLSAMLRYAAPNIISVSAIPRYNNVDKQIYQSFTQEQQNIFEYYANGSNMDDHSLKKMISKYLINTIIVTDENIAAHIMNKQQFSIAKIVCFENGEGAYYVLVATTKDISK